MNEYRFYELMGDIDPEIIAAADRPVHFRKKRGFKIMLVAAVLALAILVTPLAGAFALASSYKAAHPEFEGNFTEAIDRILSTQDLPFSGLITEELLDIDWDGLKKAISSDGGVDWNAFFAVLRGEQPKPDPTSEVFKATELGDGTVMITEYTGESETVIVPEKIMGKTVTAIGEYAFAENKAIRELILPNTVTKIDRYAFYLCSLLKTVQLSQNIREIGDGAFAQCFTLSLLYAGQPPAADSQDVPAGAYFPDSLHTLGRAAFEYCRDLKHVVIKPTLKNWNDAAAFAGSGLQTVTVMDGVTEIASFAFYACPLKEITLPSSVTRIGYDAFFGCTQLQSITLNEGLISIETGAFDEVGLSSIVIPSTVTEMENVVFTGSKNLTQVIFAGDAPAIYERPYGSATSTQKDEDLANVPDYTVYYFLGAKGFENGEWNGHACEPMPFVTEPFTGSDG